MRPAIAAATAVTTVVFCSSFAHASELSEKGNAKIRYFNTLTDCTAERKPELLDHSDLVYARGAVSKCESYAENAERWLSEVPEADRKHPDYLAALAKQSKRKATIAEWRKNVDARSAAAKASFELEQQLKKDAEALTDAFFLAEKVEKDPKKAAAMDRSSDWPPAAERFAAVAAFAKNCDGKYKGVKTTFRFGRDYAPADEGCQAAKKAVAFLPKGFDEHVKARSARIAADIKHDLAEIAAGKRVYEHTIRDLVDMKAYVEKERATYNALLAKFGLPSQPGLFDEWTTAAKGLDAALAAAKKKNALAGAAFKDGALGPLATQRAKTVGVPAKAVSYGFYKPQGELEKNDFGIPTARFRHGRVLLQLPNESFCRAYEITLRSDYAGGGRYERYYLVDEDPIGTNDQVTIGACAK